MEVIHSLHIFSSSSPGHGASSFRLRPANRPEELASKLTALFAEHGVRVGIDTTIFENGVNSRIIHKSYDEN